MLKAIAFDFDGVLLESVDVKTRAFRTLFAQESPAQLAQIVDYHLQNGGISRFEKFRTIYNEILRRPLDEAEFHSLCDRFAQCVIDEVVASPWVPGAREFLNLHRGDYRFFVVSGTPDTEIKTIIQRRGLASYFVEVLGSPRKKADLLKEMMSRHALAPEDVVYVGDAINDWHAAREQSIGFVWRRTHADLPPLPGFQGPTISTLTELHRALTRLPVSEPS
jgi:phosphoglycolate phosphatase